MESKYQIICPECGEDRSRTFQHRLRRANGGILDSRNKKEECKECQDFFDGATWSAVSLMKSTGSLIQNNFLEQNNKIYLLENYMMFLPFGSSTIFQTGSPVEAGIAEAVGAPRSTRCNQVVRLGFIDGAPIGYEWIKVENKLGTTGSICLSILSAGSINTAISPSQDLMHLTSYTAGSYA